MQTERIDQAIHDLLHVIQSDQIPEVVSRSIIHSQHGELPSAKWSIGNQILMFLSQTEDARGYQQWQAAGRQVKKGSHAIYIWAPSTKKTIDDKTGEESYYITGFHTIPVFRIEDTDGPAIIPPDYRPQKLPRLYDVAAKLGVNVRYTAFVSNYYGYYSDTTKTITLCSHDEETFFHELSHAVHATLCTLKNGQDPKQEVVAELSAATLAHYYGKQQLLGTSLNYVLRYAQSHNSQQALRFIMGVLTEVKTVVTKILSLTEDAELRNVG